jgi:hypothetical protein
MISEQNLVWSQDVLVDRTGYLRRRGPFTQIETDLLGTDEYIAGMASTHDPTGAWRMCALASDADSSRIVFYNTSGSITGWSWLPFKHPNGSYTWGNTDEENDTIRFQNPMTMFKGREALGGGAFLSVFTRYGIPTFNAGAAYPRFQSLYFWRGGHGVDCYTPSATFHLDSGVGIAQQLTTEITLNSAVDSVITGETPSVTPGMFVFDADPALSGRPYQCIGVVKSVSGSTITLERKPMVGHRSDAFNASTNTITAPTGIVLHFRNIRGFQHLHGRGLITVSSGTVVTSGLEGSGTDGQFAAAHMNDTSTEWYVYRNSDHALLGKVSASGAMSNEQFTLVNAARINMASDEYIAVRKMTVLSTDYNITASAPALEPSPYYQARMSGKVDDAAAGTSNDDTARTPADVPGYLTATYASLQWYGSLGQNGYENQIAFSSYHDPEAVDLSTDAADTIVIPGVNIMRGLATSASGLIIFMADNTYILRGNDRTNFSLEVLYPQGCLSEGSIVEVGGGVMWAATSGILYYDGASVRNLTDEGLGAYYYDSVKHFDANADRIYAFMYKNYLFMTFTKWNSPYSFSRFRPLYVNTAAGDVEGASITWNNNVYPPTVYTEYGYTWNQAVNREFAIGFERYTNYLKNVTFALYLPTGSITALSNFEFVGATFLDAIDVASSTSELTYERCWVGLNARKRTNASEFIEGRVPNILTQAVRTSGSTVTVTFDNNWISQYNPDITGYIANGSLIDIIDRNDDSVVSSVTVASLGSSTFTFNLGYTPAFPSTPTTNQEFTDSRKVEWIWTGSVWKIKYAVGYWKPQYRSHNRGAFVGVDDMLDLTTNEEDSYITVASEANGPDLYFQTKAYTVGDPVIKKWFQRLMVSMLIKGGAIRIDLLDYENNDFVTGAVKQRNWALLPELLYPWTTAQSRFADLTNVTQTDTQTPPQTGTSWINLQNLAQSWDDVLFPAFERRMKRFSQRTNALGYQFYQVNKWRPPGNSRANVVRPKRVEADSWAIGFKALRSGRQ